MSRPRELSRAALVLIAVAGLASGGCGGASPLLHPAHTLPEGVIEAGVGPAAQFVTGSAATRITEARETTVVGARPAEDDALRYRRGAAAIAALAPGLSSVLTARAGMAWGSEGGITATGHGIRIDARKAVTSGPLAFSVGIGGTGVRGRPGASGSDELAGLSVEGVKGGGLDVPLLVGWRSDAGLLAFWAGLRGGYERLGGRLCLRCDDRAGVTSAPVDWSAGRAWGGGLVGFRAGFRHVFVSLEVDGAYQRVSGRIEDGLGDVRVSGFTVAPAGAISGRFY